MTHTDTGDHRGTVLLGNEDTLCVMAGSNLIKVFYDSKAHVWRMHYGQHVQVLRTSTPPMIGRAEDMHEALHQ
jgi:hypothetical protein